MLQFASQIVFLSLKIFLVLANSADPDEMPHHAAFHLGFHCLSKVHIKESLVYKHFTYKSLLLVTCKQFGPRLGLTRCWGPTRCWA